MANILFIDGKIVFDADVIVFTDDPELCYCCEPPPLCDCLYGCATFSDGSETGVATITDTPCETGYWVHVEGGLEVWGNGLTFYDGRWEIANLRGDSAGWEGYYLGPSTPCPDGTYVLETIISGTPPPTITVTTGPCSTSICADCHGATNSATTVTSPDAPPGSDIFDVTLDFVSSGDPGGLDSYEWWFEGDVDGFLLTLNIICDDDGNTRALLDYTGIFNWGDESGYGVYRDITGDVVCIGGSLSGTFRLYRDPLDLTDYIDITF